MVGIDYALLSSIFCCEEWVDIVSPLDARLISESRLRVWSGQCSLFAIFLLCIIIFSVSALNVSIICILGVRVDVNVYLNDVLVSQSSQKGGDQQ